MRWVLHPRLRWLPRRLREALGPVQRTFVYCPGCEPARSVDLVGDATYGKTKCWYLDGDPSQFVHYSCERCGMHSWWDFDMPAPMLVGKNLPARAVARSGAPCNAAALPDWWDGERAKAGKDPSTCAAELRRALSLEHAVRPDRWDWLGLGVLFGAAIVFVVVAFLRCG